MASPRTLLRRRRPRAAAAWRALLLAAAAATATTQRCSAFLGWALGSAGHAPPRRAPPSAAVLSGSRVPRASRGGEAAEVDGAEAEGVGFSQISFDGLEVGQAVKVRAEFTGTEPRRLTFSMRSQCAKLQVGQKLTGIVRNLEEFGAFVDVGAECSGLLHVRQVAEQPVDDIHDYLKVGQEVEVWVSKVRRDGKFELTMLQSKLPLKLEVGQKRTGIVRRIEDFGAIVDIGAEGAGLLHKSNVADDILDHLKVGQEVEVWISGVRSDGKFAVAMVQSTLPLKLEVGQKLTGVVRQIEDFGAFVDVGAVRSGLLHMSNVAEQRVDDIHDYLRVGQEVEVWVSAVHDDGKFALTMVQSKIGARQDKSVDAERESVKLEVGHKLTGVVRKIEDFGAFVDVGATRSGLLHVSNVAVQRVDDIHDYLRVGQEVEVWVSKVRDDGKFDFTMVQSKLPLKLEVGQKLTGTVRRIEDFGAFVDIGASNNGLLHVSNVAKQRVDDIHDYLRVGQEVEVWVSKVRDDGKFDLTLVQSKLPPKLKVGQKLTGTVRQIEDFGAFVDVGASGNGLLHVSNVAEQPVDDIHGHLEVDQEVEVWVREVRDDGKFLLTMVQSKIADDSAFAGVSPDVWLDATVLRMTPAGAVVSVSPPSGGAAQERFVPALNIKAGGLEDTEAGDDGTH